jgi:hypothetical protein
MVSGPHSRGDRQKVALDRLQLMLTGVRQIYRQKLIFSFFEPKI